MKKQNIFSRPLSVAGLLTALSIAVSVCLSDAQDRMLYNRIKNSLSAKE